MLDIIRISYLVLLAIALQQASVAGVVLFGLLLIMGVFAQVAESRMIRELKDYP